MTNICQKCNTYRDLALFKGKYYCADCFAEMLHDADIEMKKEKKVKLTDLNLLASECHSQALKSGFYEKEIELLEIEGLTQDQKDYILTLSISQKIMLIVSELAEKIEAMRIGKKADLSLFEKCKGESSEIFFLNFKKHIKDTMEDELADALIRIFDLAGYMKMDVNKHIEYKRAYNAIRCKKEGKRHGKEF